MENEKKSKNGVLIVIIVILVLALVGAVGYIVYDKTMSKNTTEEKTTTEKETTYELTDEIKNDVSTKINNLSLEFGSCFSFDELTDGIKVNGYSINSELFQDLKISDNTKKLIVLGSQNQLSISDYYANMPSDLKSSLTGNDINNTSGIWVVKVSEANDYYYDLFGEEYTFNADVGNFPYYHYDSTNQVYYGVSRAGGTTATEVYTYKYDYKMVDEDTVTVNLAVGYVGPTDETANSSDNSTSSYKYDSSNNTVFVEKNVTDFKLDDSNKDDYNNYKFTFKKNKNNTYSFSKIERL